MNAIYARQSIDKKDSLSIEAQIEQCKKFAGEDAEVFFDKGYSGKNTNRPSFAELIGKVKSGETDKIFVYRLDRFSRSIADFSRIWELLDKYNVGFYSATENFDTSTPMGRAMLNIILVFAQLERETTSERVKDNYIHRFKSGAWAGGPAPYGFDLTKIKVDGVRSSSLVSNENSEIVKRIFEEYTSTDVSLRQLAKNLTAQGIHGPKREIWDNVTLSRILHSPAYVRATADVYWHYLAKGLQVQQDINAFDGTYACNVIGRRNRAKNKYNSTDGQMLTISNHQGFIEPDIWLKAQEKLKKNSQIFRINAGKYSWLTGLMKCQKCGYAIKINYNKREDEPLLICSGKSNFSACDATINVELRELEDYVAEKIDEIFKNPNFDEITPYERDISLRILAIDEKIERLINVLSATGDISSTYISCQIEKLHNERICLLKDTERKTTSNNRIEFYALNFDEKKLAVSQFIEKIYITNNEVNIEWKI